MPNRAPPPSLVRILRAADTAAQVYPENQLLQDGLKQAKARLADFEVQKRQRQENLKDKNDSHATHTDKTDQATHVNESHPPIPKEKLCTGDSLSINDTDDNSLIVTDQPSGSKDLAPLTNCTPFMQLTPFAEPFSSAQYIASTELTPTVRLPTSSHLTSTAELIPPMHVTSSNNSTGATISMSDLDQETPLSKTLPLESSSLLGRPVSNPLLEPLPWVEKKSLPDSKSMIWATDTSALLDASQTPSPVDNRRKSVRPYVKETTTRPSQFPPNEVDHNLQSASESGPVFGSGDDSDSVEDSVEDSVADSVADSTTDPIAESATDPIADGLLGSNQQSMLRKKGNKKKMKELETREKRINKTQDAWSAMTDSERTAYFAKLTRKQQEKAWNLVTREELIKLCRTRPEFASFNQRMSKPQLIAAVLTSAMPPLPSLWVGFREPSKYETWTKGKRRRELTTEKIVLECDRLGIPTYSNCRSANLTRSNKFIQSGGDNVPLFVPKWWSQR